MIKQLASIICFVLSRVKIMNPTNASPEEMLQELRSELRAELAEMKQLKNS